MAPTIHIEKKPGLPSCQALYWLREEGSTVPYAYIERKGNQWWLGGMAVCGYFPTRKAALAAAV